MPYMYDQDQANPTRFSYSTTNASSGYNPQNQQIANSLAPVYGPRDTTSSQDNQNASDQSQQQTTQPALPDWLNPQAFSQLQSLFQSNFRNNYSALPGGVSSYNQDQERNRIGGLSSVNPQQPYGQPSFGTSYGTQYGSLAQQSNPYQGTDYTRLSNDPFQVTSAARAIFR